MDRSQLILAVHALIALVLVGVGAVRVSAGNVGGGVLSVVMATLVVGLGYVVARQH